MGKHSILILEDDAMIAESLVSSLSREMDAEFLVAHNTENARQIVKQSQPSVVVTDLRLPDGSGLDFLRFLRSSDLMIPVILMTGFGTAQTAIDAMKAGAFDYILKPFVPKDLIPLLQKAMQVSALTSSRTVSFATDEGEETDGADLMIGQTPQMLEVFKQIGIFSPKSVTVLITGESGTGKELIARSIWQNSTRFDAPFVAVNCAAIPDSLLESEFFGFEKGAFTGAVTQRIGRFEQANGGTLFLDEIGELPIEMQSKLLRTLQEGTVQRIGSSAEIAVNVRIIAATNRNLIDEIAQGRFREDLYYRLNVANIHLPPLRERREDIPHIFRYLIRKTCAEMELKPPAIDPELEEFLVLQNWPGNVRELENSLRKALLNARGYPLNFHHFSAASDSSIVEFGESSGRGSFSKLEEELEWVKHSLTAQSKLNLASLTDVVERCFIEAVLERLNGNQTQSAKVLGISRQTLINKMKVLSIS